MSLNLFKCFIHPKKQKCLTIYLWNEIRQQSMNFSKQFRKEDSYKFQNNCPITRSGSTSQKNNNNKPSYLQAIHYLNTYSSMY